MELKTTFIKDYHSKEFKKVFIEYFAGFGIEIDDECEVFDDISKSSEEEGQETLAYVNEENKIIAFIMFQIDEFESVSNFFRERIGFIREFYVRKDVQKRGLGSKLLNEATCYLKSKDVNKLLLTYDEDAEGFYLNQGFLNDKSYISKNNEGCMIKLI